ncbi:DUF4293 domain-containing protein [Blattabacterium sp. DPU]|uniref:DUF4293 family protein n=1 Tax=Blattabacterium sp. DPU TaxID=2715232 RepID=UPI001407943A|nr:DUF4293 family protein [Blattabacterium sp. DPU]QIK16855.1 DUF4293 domain-containing protein [Blattabacterium sp. DPU]
MLYRIQTLYSLISIFIYSVFIYFLLNHENITDFFYLNLYLKKIILFIIIICLFISILSFLLFNRNKLQIFCNKINILTNTSYVIILFFSYTQLNKYTTLIMFLFFILCICILYLTNKAIKKDIKLIDSINRIR